MMQKLFGYCCVPKRPKIEECDPPIKITDFDVIRPIGKGGFGKVFEVEMCGIKFAMKEMLKARILAKQSLGSVM